MARRAVRATVGDVCDALDAFAPFRDAAEWDNVGLLAGRREWQARRALTAIDLTDDVAREALAKKIDTLVVYHPPIFKGIKSITPDADTPTTLLPDLLAAPVAIIALHTAFDHAVGGINDLLLDSFELSSREPLVPTVRTDDGYKLVVFVPAAEVERLREALAAAGAGVIGNYTHCSYELSGQGTFFGDETTRPAVGRKLALERVDETRLEMAVPAARAAEVVRALYANHSYEEPAFDLYPTARIVHGARSGSGRVGRLKRATRGSELLRKLGETVDLSLAMSVGNLKRRFTSVTAAAGSYGVRAFRDVDSLVLTGEFSHHDALNLQRRTITAVRLDHYASEQPLLAVVRRRLSRAVRGLSVSVSRKDRSPFRRLDVC